MDKHNVLDLKKEIDKLINEGLDKRISEKSTTANAPSMTNHPRHYNREGAMECIDELELIFGPEVVAHFCLCNVLKYRYRAGLKNDGYEDLEKSDWYMRKYKKLKENIQSTQSILGDTITVSYTPTTPIMPWKINPVTWTCTTSGRGKLANE